MPPGGEMQNMHEAEHASASKEVKNTAANFSNEQ